MQAEENDDLGMTLSDIISIDADTPEAGPATWRNVRQPQPALPGAAQKKTRRGKKHRGGSPEQDESLYTAWGGKGKGSLQSSPPRQDGQGGKGRRGKEGKGGKKGGKGGDKGWKPKEEKKQTSYITCAGCGVKIPANQAVGHASQCNRLAQSRPAAAAKPAAAGQGGGGAGREAFTSAYSLFIAKKLEGVKNKRGGMPVGKWKEMSPAEKFQDLADRNRVLKESLLQRMTDATSEWESMSYEQKRPFIVAAGQNKPEGESRGPSPPHTQMSPQSSPPQQLPLPGTGSPQHLSPQQLSPPQLSPQQVSLQQLSPQAQQQQLQQLLHLQQIQQQNIMQLQMVQQGLTNLAHAPPQAAANAAAAAAAANRSDPALMMSIGSMANSSHESLLDTQQAAATVQATRSMDDMALRVQAAAHTSMADFSMRELSASCPQLPKVSMPGPDSSAAQLAALALYLGEVGLVPKPKAPTEAELSYAAELSRATNLANANKSMDVRIGRHASQHQDKSDKRRPSSVPPASRRGARRPPLASPGNSSGSVAPPSDTPPSPTYATLAHEGHAPRFSKLEGGAAGIQALLADDSDDDEVVMVEKVHTLA